MKRATQTVKRVCKVPAAEVTGPFLQLCNVGHPKLHLLLLSRSLKKEKSQKILGGSLIRRENQRQRHCGEDLPVVIRGPPPPLTLAAAVCTPVWGREAGRRAQSPSPTWHSRRALAPHFWHRTTSARAPERHMPVAKQSALKKQTKETFHPILTQSIHRQVMFCDLNFGTNSTLGPKSRTTRSKFQRNRAAL